MHPASPPERFNLAQWLLEGNVSAGRGDYTAVVCSTGETLTYRQLRISVDNVARALRRRDVQVEQRVLLALPEGPEFIISFLALLQIGAVAVPVSTSLAPADYTHILADSRAVLAVAAADCVNKLGSAPHLHGIVSVGHADARSALPITDWREFVNMGETHPESEVPTEPTSRDDAAFWLYSSGTMGLPKAVVHLHRDALAACEGYARGVLGMTDQDRILSAARLLQSSGLCNSLIFPFYFGGSSLLTAQPLTAGHLNKLIRQFAPTILFARPSNYAALLAEPAERIRDLGSVRLAVSSGDVLPRPVFDQFLERFGVEILPGVGSTELLHIYLSNRQGRVVAESAGELVPGYEARLIDEDAQPVGDGAVGELLIRGGSTFACYWNQRDKTRAAFQGEWFRTGDKFRRDANSFYWYVGRSDDLWLANGTWISPAEIEAVLCQHPLVADAGVAGVHDADNVVRPRAWVVLRVDAVASPSLADELQDFVRERTDALHTPTEVHVVSSLPRTPSGKLQRYRLAS